jgi:hypothetical protein
VSQGSNRIIANITIAQSVYRTGVTQGQNHVSCNPVQQNPNRIDAPISMAKDAYQIAKERDPSIGTRDEWIASLQGAPGETPVYDPIKTTLTGDGVTSVFTIGGAGNIINPAAVVVDVDGASQEPGVDYFIAGGEITFTSPLEDGAKAVIIAVSSLALAERVGTSWSELLNSWTSEPILNIAIAGGEVFDYVYATATFYRFVPDPYVSSQDAFYAAFEAGVLSGLIASRS